MFTGLMKSLNFYVILLGILGFTTIIFLENSYSVEISQNAIDSISDLTNGIPSSALNTNGIVTTSATLDFGTLQVAT